MRVRFSEWVRRIPTPICGTALGLTALGNLLQKISPAIRPVCGVFACIFLVLFLLRIIFCFPDFAKDMKNPALAGISGTFCMAGMIFSVYLKAYAPGLGKGIWFGSLALHVVLIICFTAFFMLPPVMEKVYASYYVVYVGIAAAGVSAPAWGMQRAGMFLFWFGTVSFVLLLILVTRRYLSYRNVPAPLKPVFSIYAAPASLCLAAYLNSFSEKNVLLASVLFLAGLVLYIPALINALRLIGKPFVPGMSAFTFPFVISAVATVNLQGFVSAQTAKGFQILCPVIGVIGTVQTVIAAVFVICITVRYLIRIFSPAV